MIIIHVWWWTWKTFYSVAMPRAKQQKINLVEDIGSEYCVDLKALQKIEHLNIFTRG